MKEINLDQTLSSIVSQYPELIDLLYDIGFTQIKVPGMLQTAGRFMTLRSGCELRKIDINQLSIKLKENGYEIKEDSN
ncbi:MAG: DUF1858 domain-containing protein [Erysipelotrichaceae bacterium]|nr:DUF1858 domain-containing protein [Erysipelotrichaceae bacterium]